MALQEKFLSQTILDTSSSTIYSVPTGNTAIIKSILICNNTASARQFSIYADADGTTSDDTTALFNDTSIAANSGVSINTFIVLDTSGSIMANCNQTSGITISLFGAEIT